MNRAARNTQRGVAVVMAMLFVAIVVVALATLGRQIYGSSKRAANINSINQIRSAEQSLANALALKLQFDANAEPPVDSAESTWVDCESEQSLYEDLQMLGCIYEQNGRFNLNNLRDAEGRQIPEQVNRFKYLLAELGLPLSIADAIGDWLDTDEISNGFDQESQFYRLRRPSYLPASDSLSSPSELALIKPFLEKPEDLETLLPHVTLIPNNGVPSPINPNFASEALLMAYIVVPEDFKVTDGVRFSPFADDEILNDFKALQVDWQSALDAESEASEAAIEDQPALDDDQAPAALRSYADYAADRDAFGSSQAFVDFVEANVSAPPREDDSLSPAQPDLPIPADSDPQSIENQAPNAPPPPYIFSQSDNITVQSNYFLIELSINKNNIKRQYFSLWQREGGQMTRLWQSENTW